MVQFVGRMRMKVAKPFGKHLPPDSLRITLCDSNSEMVQAWATRFSGVDSVEILEGNLLNLNCQALVSPANSFGDMGGGIEQHIDRFYGGAAQPAVMATIADRFYGEMPVGIAVIIPMSSKCFPFLVTSPTMRIPGNVFGSINAYLSMRAALIAILQHNSIGINRIESVAVPGLCSGVGGMSCDEVAQQMRTAHDNVVGGQWKQVLHPALAPYVLKEDPS
jgi:O-acetyl-ADP-ribose deacetylase (regulator of RNase III)